MDYKRSMMLYSTMLYSTDVTHAIYHRSEMQGASMINLSRSITLTIMINTLLSLEQKYSSQKSREPDEQYKHNAYLTQKLITRDISKASSSRTWIRQGTSHKKSTDRPSPPPNSSLTLYLTISIHRTRYYRGLIFSS